MFKELTDKINYSDVEKANLKFWEENKIFEESITSRNGKPLYTFYEGPPTANGRPGILAEIHVSTSPVRCSGPHP